MLDVIAPFAVPGGAAGIALATVWLVLTGRLIPLSTVDRLLEVKDRELQTVTAGYEAEKARNELLSRQVNELMELSRTTVGIVNAIPRARDTAA
jgi:hypothetical protein